MEAIWNGICGLGLLLDDSSMPVRTAGCLGGKIPGVPAHSCSSSPADITIGSTLRAGSSLSSKTDHGAQMHTAASLHGEWAEELLTAQAHKNLVDV